MFASQAGLLRGPQYSASSNPFWTSTTIRAAFGSSVTSGMVKVFSRSRCLNSAALLESPPTDGKTPAGRTRAGPGGQRPLLDGLRERGFLDLLRARLGRELRARPDADRLHHHRLLLPLYGR